MGKPSLIAPPEAIAEPLDASTVLRAPVVLDLGNPCAADYARHVGGRISMSGDIAGSRDIVIFLGRQWTSDLAGQIDGITDALKHHPARSIIAVAGFGSHLGDAAAIDLENRVLPRLRPLTRALTCFRTGHILSASSAASTTLRRLAPLYPLASGRLRGCCIEGQELFAAIEAERQPARESMRRHRFVTLMGPNRPWRDWLHKSRSGGAVAWIIWLASYCLSLLGIGWAASLFLRHVRVLHVKTLCPRSFRELRSLYNVYNYHYVKLVGYNNGVNHFGQQFPGRTVVSTIHLNRIVAHGPDAIRADAGVTVRKALDFLSPRGQDLYVIPNYSYVCLGTAFFVPIHGSAADYSCVVDTVSKALLYDPTTDRMVLAGSDSEEFRQHVYAADSPVLLLRLYVRVKAKSRFYMKEETKTAQVAQQLLADLRDTFATNVEIRKGKATEETVRVLKFYNDTAGVAGGAVELPRDRLGQLWDRLEENPITCWLMHLAGRRLLWHIELFFTADEFATFWETHRTVPLRKMQFRHIRRDGLPRSPFRDHDCISVDTFAFRWHREKMEAYLARTFGSVRLNPGKHSR